MNMHARELIVDSFAGGGGASAGIEMALGRAPDIAINHDAEALAMHAMNHPESRHLPHNVWKVDPVQVTGGVPVGLLWASPDCKHHSKAKGGKPVKKNIRDLAWVVVRWARQVRPRVIILENVEEFRDWGPLGIDMRPCPDRKGKTFEAWVANLRRLGYRVEWKELRACEYGAPTIRKRLFVIARRDGHPIVWPAPTHGKPGSPGVVSGRLAPWRTAAEIIDWSLPCPSIFLTREEGRAIGCNRPLAENTMARIAKGVKRYVIDAAEPFVVTYGQQGGASRSSRDPLHTVTASAKDTNAIVVPHLMTMRNAQKPFTAADQPTHTVTAGGAGLSLVASHLTKFNTGSVGSSLDEPAPTVTANSYIKRPGGAAPVGVVAAFLAQHNTGVVGRDARDPVSTIVGTGSTQAVVSAGLMNMKGSARGMSGVDEPLRTICAGTVHAADVRAFLVKYYGADQDPRLEEPLHTVTTKHRFGLVTIEGEIYTIADIGMRMLAPRELFRAQGFPDSYEIETGRDPDGTARRLTKTSQVRMCGNSVCPPLARALVSANYVPGEIAKAARPVPSLPLMEAARV